MAETIDTILERMLLQIPSRYDTSSGTYTYDIEKSTAMEFENVYDIISSLDSYFYASTATGKYLDMRVGEFGLERKEASYATGYVTVSGNVGAKVSVGEKVAAGNVIFNIMELCGIVKCKTTHYNNLIFQICYCAYINHSKVQM